MSDLRALATAHDAELPGHPLADVLMGYQRAGVRFAMGVRRTIIGDDMGLGKTAAAIATLVGLAEWPALIVVPPSLTLNWVKEFAKWSPATTVHCITGLDPYDLPDAQVYVISDAILAPREGAEGWLKSLKGVTLRAIVVDEIQRFKSLTAGRTQALLDLARTLPDDPILLGLTGTLSKKDAMDALPPLEFVRQLVPLFRSRALFRTMFNGSDAISAEHLYKTIIGRCYVRREFNDVKYQFGDRAPAGDVIRLSIAIEMTGDAADQYHQARNDFRSWVREHRAEVDVDRIMRVKALARYGALRRLSGLSKIAATVDYVRTLAAPTLVFAEHRDVVTAIARALNGNTIMGGMSVAQVEEAKATFTAQAAAGHNPVLVLNIEAGGVGHTLTAAQHVVFVEYAASPSDMEQCEARAYRLGQTQQVYSHWLVGNNGASTIDEKRIDMLNRRARVTGAINSGKGDVMLDETNELHEIMEWAIDTDERMTP